MREGTHTSLKMQPPPSPHRPRQPKTPQQPSVRLHGTQALLNTSSTSKTLIRAATRRPTQSRLFQDQLLLENIKTKGRNPTSRMLMDFKKGNHVKNPQQNIVSLQSLRAKTVCLWWILTEVMGWVGSGKHAAHIKIIWEVRGEVLPWLKSHLKKRSCWSSVFGRRKFWSWCCGTFLLPSSLCCWQTWGFVLPSLSLGSNLLLCVWRGKRPECTPTTVPHCGKVQDQVTDGRS